MTEPRFVVVVLACVALLTGCTLDPEPFPDPPMYVTGTVQWRERIALPPDATVTVRLEDVSVADVPPDVVASWSEPLGDRSPPIAFAVEYGPEQIRDDRHYALRAIVRVGERRVFTTTAPRRVLGEHGNGPFEILVRGAGSSGAVADRDLVGVRWELVELRGAAVEAGESRRVPFVEFDADGGYRGSGGINQMSGRFERSDGELRIRPGPITEMAGPEPAMRLEDAFVDALGGVDGYRIDGDRLTLLADDEAVLGFRAAER